MKYENCFVAFLDILGFKNKVFETKKNNKLLELLINSLKISCYFPQSGTKRVEKRKIEVKSYFFSDSFVFMMKENEKDLAHLFLIVRYLQDRFWESELCLRGAITIGKMYWPKNNKENIILGPAMIEAYKLESQIAIYPRIVISDTLLKYINDKNKNISARPIGHEEKKLKQFIKKDNDGVAFFDILNPEIIRKTDEKLKNENDEFGIYWSDDMESSYENIVAQVHKIVKKEINNKNEKVRQKYEWLKSYLEDREK